MIGFEITTDDGQKKSASIPVGVVSLIFSKVSIKDRDELYFSLTGSDTENAQYITWANQDLELGDKVTIEVKDIDENSPPEKVEHNNANEFVLEAKLRSYKELQKELRAAGLID